MKNSGSNGAGCMVILVIALLVLFSWWLIDVSPVDIDGREIPRYGLFNQHDKIPGVQYEISVKNVIASIVFSESLVVPIMLVGFCLYEPVSD